MRRGERSVLTVSSPGERKTSFTAQEGKSADLVWGLVGEKGGSENSDKKKRGGEKIASQHADDNRDTKVQRLWQPGQASAHKEVVEKVKENDIYSGRSYPLERHLE